MKFQTILIVGMVCCVPLLEAKRSFGITRSRNKGNKPSVRRNQQGHEYDDNPMPPVHHPKPSAPDMKRPINHSPPAGPPPPYPGMNHHNTPIYGAPPAYSPSYASPPGYSSGMGGMSLNQPRFAQSPGAFGSYSQPMGHQAMPMGVVPMGSYNYGNRGGGSGIMTNLFAGLAGYQLARAFSGGSHYHHQQNYQQPDREVVIIDNRQLPAGTIPLDTTVPLLPLNEKPHTDIVHGPSTEIPQEHQAQVGPANNEYNHYGLPQYGVPLYGYNMPAQITDYYQTAVVSRPQSESEQIPAMGRK